jgi:DNA-directed RNA polymerase beta subunit
MNDHVQPTILGRFWLNWDVGDGTSFGIWVYQNIMDHLQNLGREPRNEILYNGMMTGEQIETSIFIGPVFTSET